MLDATNEQEVTLHAKRRIWKVAKDKIESMASDIENCPIVLEEMSFEIFSKFIILKNK